MKDTHVQYGAGWCAPSEWRNFDSSPTLWLERLPILGHFVQKNAQRFPDNVEYGNIVTGLPVAWGSCVGIYASHVLEHLALYDLRAALQNTHKMLCKGGCFRLIVPDLEWITHEYLVAKDAGAAERFVDQSGLGRQQRPTGLREFVRAYLGNSPHLWMWDYKGLTMELEQAGFQMIRRCRFHDAQDPLFEKVEDAGRFENALAIEAMR